MFSEKRVTVCTKKKSPLTCETPGSSIAVNDAFWGRLSPDICPSDDGDPVTNCSNAPGILDRVKEMCEGTSSCKLEARANKLQKGKHCYGVQKYLQVSYTCVPRAKEVLLCDSERTILSCPSDWLIKINSAFWGRQSSGVCPTEQGNRICSGASETVSKLRSKCNESPYCAVGANVKDLQNGGEKCPRVNKYLIVNYGCNPSLGVARRGHLGRIPMSLLRNLYRSYIPRPGKKSKIPKPFKRLQKKKKSGRNQQKNP